MKESSRIQTVRQRMAVLEKQCLNCIPQKCHTCKVAVELAEIEYSVETGHISKRRHG